MLLMSTFPLTRVLDGQRAVQLASWQSGLDAQETFQRGQEKLYTLEIIAEIVNFAIDGIPSGWEDHSFKA